MGEPTETLRAALIVERDRMRAAYENTNLSEMNRHGAFQSMCALNRVLDAAAIPPEQDGYAPCPTCRQYSHSIGEDALSKAYRHFNTLIGHPVRGHPMGEAFDEATRDAANVLIAAATDRHAEGRIAGLEEAANRRPYCGWDEPGKPK